MPKYEANEEIHASRLFKFEDFLKTDPKILRKAKRK
jgi:hypothetical protein